MSGIVFAKKNYMTVKVSEKKHQNNIFIFYMWL
jgi:hypothetical protein